MELFGAKRDVRMSKADYYDLLGVNKGADDATLKKAYRKLAMQYHPDKNPGDTVAESKFKELSEAYDVLKDPEKRAAYDRYGHSAFEGGMGGGGGEPFDFGDIFEEFFGRGGRSGGGSGRRGAARGADLRYNLEVSLEDVFNGKSEEISITTAQTCGICRGTGSAKGSSPDVCTTCNGSGKLRASQGFFMVERTCHACSGRGQTITNPCGTCSGAGRINKEKTLKISIPKGVEEGTRIRLSGEGEAGTQGAPAGDLYIFISIAPHRFFKRDGDMLYCRVPIPMASAVLGGTVEVPTIGGSRARVKIPEGTQTGKKIRLKGKGMPELNGGFVGDMLIETVVETPVNLSKKQRQLMEDFASESGDTVSPQSAGFFSKVKEIWDDLTE